MIGFNDKRHYYFLVIYLAVNYILHIFSVTDAVYIHGADASRYYTSALSLSNGHGLGNLLSSGPVYPLFVSMHYKLLGFDYGNDILVVTQSFLLYITGFIAGKLAIKFLPLSGGIFVMLLVIFNPNALMSVSLKSKAVKFCCKCIYFSVIALSISLSIIQLLNFNLV